MITKKEFITWSKKLSVGMPEIDQQHQKFIGLINRTHNLVKEKAKEKELRQILNELTEYARVHFSTEEKYFKEFHYKYEEEHEEEHEKLLIKVLDFNNQFEEQGIKILGTNEYAGNFLNTVDKREILYQPTIANKF